MAAEWQGRAFNATGQPPQLKMLMKLAQTVEVDRAVVHPDALNQVGDCGRPLDTEEGLVDQIEYVAHFPRSFSSLGYAVRPYSSDESAWSAIASTPSEVVSTARANA